MPTDPSDGHRYTIQTSHNVSDGTLASVTDQLGNVFSFQYDDYRRLKKSTSPGHGSQLQSFLYYGAAQGVDDYTFTDSDATYSISGNELITTVYDENRRRSSVTTGNGSPTPYATTNWNYDPNGNVLSVVSPLEQSGQQFAGKSTSFTYDARNRLMSSVDALNDTTTIKYDAGGRRASVTRPNGQVVTFDSFDAMNRLLQQTVKQSPNPDSVSNDTYYTSGLLNTFTDPRNSTYSYSYDQIGRKTKMTYPDSSNDFETWHFDAAGRVDTFTNRATNVDTLGYDNLNRLTTSTWNDGITPAVTYGYDVASRLTSIVNSNATISRSYSNDGLLASETSKYADITPRTVIYTYDSNNNRSSIQYPDGTHFYYHYNSRNQISELFDGNSNSLAIFGYDLDGNLTSRTPTNNTSSSYAYDAVDRVTHISHALNGMTRTFDYAYDSVSNRKWQKRDGTSGDVFGYDMNNQSSSVLLNVANPDTTAPGAQTINYDAAGNFSTFNAEGQNHSYSTNALSQYTTRDSSTASYSPNGNMTAGFDASSYSYDARNRLLSASKAGTTDTFQYDGLNRQVRRTSGTGSPVYNVYDGWNLIAEYAAGTTTPTNAYLYGATGVLKNFVTNRYYYQDGSASTSHLADASGNLLEWYRYDLQGTPIVYNASNTQLAAPPNVRHLFNGEQWYSELGLYDLRNRFYSPDIGRFLQSDPLGHAGGDNLYRYCSNNPLKWNDAFGLWDASGVTYSNYVQAAQPGVVVTGSPTYTAGNFGSNIPDGSIGSPGSLYGAGGGGLFGDTALNAGRGTGESSGSGEGFDRRLSPGQDSTSTITVDPDGTLRITVIGAAVPPNFVYKPYPDISALVVVSELLADYPGLATGRQRLFGFRLFYRNGEPVDRPLQNQEHILYHTGNQTVQTQNAFLNSKGILADVVGFKYPTSATDHSVTGMGNSIYDGGVYLGEASPLYQDSWAVGDGSYEINEWPY